MKIVELIEQYLKAYLNEVNIQEVRTEEDIV